MESRRKGGKVGNKVDARDETRERHISARECKRKS